jgi:hypothetical protein
MIAACRPHLRANGLALIPADEEVIDRAAAVEASTSGGKAFTRDLWTVVYRWTLAHVSGETMPVSRVMPVESGPGRPLDKALRAAHSMALSYALRDLLLVPRGEEEAVDARPDADYVPRGGHPSQRPSAQAPAVDVSAVRRAMRAHGMESAEMALAWLGVQRPPAPSRWPETQEDADALAVWLATPAAAASAREWHLTEGTPRAMAVLGALLTAEGFDPAEVVKDVRRRRLDGLPMDPTDGPTASRWWAWWQAKGREVYGLAREGAE